MPDMLVKLYELPQLGPLSAGISGEGVEIRRGLVPEKHLVLDWVGRTFGPGWASECEVAFTRQPPSCFIATENGACIGFGCYDATCKNFFGPTGVAEKARGRGIGKALLLACLHAMHAEGYAYAVIGGAGPVEFYARAVGATVIEGSKPGIYRWMLRPTED
jgi:GNAT superfamily N-acetyltransferase